MNIAMKLTLDGLVRALRTRMHQMADDAETGYAYREKRRVADRAAVRRRGMDDYDVSGD